MSASNEDSLNRLVLPKGLVRVFPRRTNATPDDEAAYVGRGPDLWTEAERVHISVAFEWDRQAAEQLAEQWRCVTSDVTIGGPAYGDAGGDFTPGLYIKRGYTITSRGCPNACWFCHAWRREGRRIRTLPIAPGWNVLDNNLLACPRPHVEAVFEMLKRQPQRPRFTGGFEAALLEPWHVEHLAELRPKVMWFAYDTPDDLEPLIAAARLLADAGLISASHEACCYVLCGWKGDTFDDAEARMRRVVGLGLFPQAMLYNRGRHFDDGDRKLWVRFAREWSNKIIVGVKMREVCNSQTMKNRKQNRRWTSAECLEAIYPKSARIRMLRLALLSGLVRRMK